MNTKIYPVIPRLTRNLYVIPDLIRNLYVIPRLTRNLYVIPDLIRNLYVIPDLIRNLYKWIPAFAGMTIILFFLPSPAFAGELSNQFTVSLWINPLTSVTSKALAVKNTEIRLYTNASGYASCAIHNGTDWQTAAADTTALPLNTWSFVSCSYDKVTLRIFVNGIQKGTSALTAAVNDAATNWRVGSDEAGTYADLAGTTDEFKIYNYARSTKQIVEDMNAGHPAVGSPVGSQIGYWKFDEGYGTTANDTSINANNLTLSTASWTNSGKFGKAWNGTNALWLSRADDSDFDVTATDDYAISLWFKSDSATNPSAAEYLVNKASSVIAGYAVYANTSGQLCFGIDDDTTWNPDIASCSTADFYDAAWHHIAAIRDTVQDKTYLYIDGVLRDSDSDTTTATLANSLSLYVGDRDGTDNGDEFTGDIDELKIYRYALTSDEVKTDYNHGTALSLGSVSVDSSNVPLNSSTSSYCVPGSSDSCSAPVGEWNFEEGSGSSAYDSSGNGNTGTATGTTVVSGKVGKARSFNGSSDTVTVSNSLSTKTVEFWINPGSTTQNLIDLRTATTAANISVSSGTISATGFTFPTIYVNGVVSSTLIANSWQYVTITTGTAITANAIQFGRISSTSLTGKLDSIRIFDYARSAAQVAWDYNKGAPVGHWKFDECQGSTVNSSNDPLSSSNSPLPGTLTVGSGGTQTSVGNCSTSATTAWYSGRTGKYNSSLNFDGTDDVVTVANTVANVGSVSFWVYPTSNTASMMQLTTTGTVTASSGTISAGAGFTSPTIYVNGKVASTLTANTWNHIVVTTATGISANAIKLGLVGSTYFAGQIDDVQIFNYALTATQIKNLFNQNSAIRFGPQTGSP